MKEKLIKLLDNSYSPYYLEGTNSPQNEDQGKEFNGVNVENASYGATICAERSAIVSAISAGYKKGDFKEIYVMCDSPKISSSCFICRQVISEFFKQDDKVIFMSNLGDEETYLVKEVCPVPFNEEDLI